MTDPKRPEYVYDSNGDAYSNSSRETTEEELAAAKKNINDKRYLPNGGWDKDA